MVFQFLISSITAFLLKNVDMLSRTKNKQLNLIFLTVYSIMYIYEKYYNIIIITTILFFYDKMAEFSNIKVFLLQAIQSKSYIFKYLKDEFKSSSFFKLKI